MVLKSNIGVVLIFFFCLFTAFTLEALDQERLKTFFKEYDSSAEKNNWQWERLSFAIERGYADIAEFLVLRGDPIKTYREIRETQGLINSYDFHYKHPLITAIRKGYVNLSVMIIQLNENMSNAEEYKDLNFKFAGGTRRLTIEKKKSALFVAICESSNACDIILAMINGGANINVSYSYFTYPQPNGYYTNTEPITPLKAAISLKKFDAAQLLLDRNADVEYCGDSNISPLYMAVDNNYIEGVNLLLSYGADPLYIRYASQLSPLELAMQKGYLDIVDLLLNAAIHD